MAAEFMNDTEYIALCGSKTVLDVVSTLISIFDRHDPGSYEAKTVGRIVDLPAIRNEISRLQPVLEDSRKLSTYFRMTALYLQERELAVQKHMEGLKRQEKEQERLRAALKAFIRGPALPKEITDTVLNHVRTSNKLEWTYGVTVYVDGLIPLAVYNPSLLLLHYEKDFSEEWTLEDIAIQGLKVTVLEDVALTNHVKLRVRTRSDFFSLRPLMKYPHQWKKLDIVDYKFDVDDFIDAFKPCLPHLEELLDVKAASVTSSGIVLPPNSTTCSCPQLKTANLSVNILSDLFNAGILNSITSLTVDHVEKRKFPNPNAFKKALNDLLLVLSRLSCLRELVLSHIEFDRTHTGLQRVRSTSLRSLDIGTSYGGGSAVTFLSVFADCPIDRLNVHAAILEGVERLFGKARHVVCRAYVPDILFERKQDGSLAFAEMEFMELLDLRLPRDELLQFQNRLLESVRVRFEDPTVCRIGHLSIPKRFVTNRQFQYELERYVPSLVLS